MVEILVSSLSLDEIDIAAVSRYRQLDSRHIQTHHNGGKNRDPRSSSHCADRTDVVPVSSCISFATCAHLDQVNTALHSPAGPVVHQQYTTVSELCSLILLGRHHVSAPF